MNFFDDLIEIPLKKDMGICNTTDEFFCLFLNKINKTNNKNILVVVNSIYAANKLYNSLCCIIKKLFCFQWMTFLPVRR